MEPVTALLRHCEDEGIGTRYAESGVSLQDGTRRDFGDAPDVIAVFTQSGGRAFPFATSEEPTIQVLVDAEDHVQARDVARQVYTLLHGIRVQAIHGVEFLWIHAIAPPQDLGVRPDFEARFAVSVNFTARVVL